MPCFVCLCFTGLYNTARTPPREHLCQRHGLSCHAANYSFTSHCTQQRLVTISAMSYCQADRLIQCGCRRQRVWDRCYLVLQWLYTSSMASAHCSHGPFDSSSEYSQSPVTPIHHLNTNHSRYHATKWLLQPLHYAVHAATYSQVEL